MKTRLAFGWFVLLFLASVAWSEDFNGKCVAVTDGDTVQVMHNGKAEKIRLDGIDAPESNQAYGTQAKKVLSSLVFDKTVLVHAREKDKYGRTLATIYDPVKSWNINAMMVRNGYAWHYKEYSTDKQLAECELTARKEKAGLWKDPNPIPPWTFRHGVPSTQSANGLTSQTSIAQQSSSQNDSLTVYVAKTGSKYHNAGCRYLKSSIPMSLKEASARYSPCSYCNPPVLGKSTGTLSSASVESPLPVSTLTSSSHATNPYIQPQRTTPTYTPPAYTGTPTGQTTPRGYQIYTGPRGGQYHYSKSGKKVYEKRK